MGWDEALGLVDPPDPTATPGAEEKSTSSRAHGTSGSRSSRGGTRRRPESDRARRRRRRAQERTPANQRRDIQGLRAVAVVIVVVNHMFDHPQGGFLGVDVFFVISGYLITGLLLREEQRTGTLSMVGFYKRRIRRLFPSALTVTVLTVIGAYLLFGHDRFMAVLLDGVFATVFVANWRFIHTGTDYFASLQAVSPLQHYWSLSVEEQYYLVWPLALLVACLVARKLSRGRAGAATAGVLTMGVVLVAASVVVAFQQTTNAPVVAYFSTFTRGWELGLGSLLAVVAPKVYPHLKRPVATGLSWLGLVVVFVSFFVVGASSVPWPGAVLPCVGSVLVILGFSAAGGEARNPVLTNPVSVYLGDISYSIYVVHFPVIVLAEALVGDRSTSVVFHVTVALLALGISVLLFHFIEDPVRRSRWLLPRSSAGRGPETVAAPRGPALALGLALCVGAIGAFVVAAPQSAADKRYEQLVADLGATPSAAPSTAAAGPATPQLDALRAELSAALVTPSWPALNPPMDQPRSRDAKTEACTTDWLPASQCTWGDPAAPHTLYLVGDSTSVAYINGIVAAAAAVPGWKVRAASGDGCPWTDTIPEELNHNWPQTCTERNTKTVEEIQQTHPDLLVVTHGHTGPDYVSGISAQLGQVKASVGKIVMLPNGPSAIDPGQCYTAVSTPADCVSQPTAAYRQVVADSTTLAGEYGGVAIDPTDWFCVDDNCPAFVGTTPIRFDQAHLTNEFSTRLGPVIQEAFHGLGLF